MPIPLAISIELSRTDTNLLFIIIPKFADLELKSKSISLDNKIISNAYICQRITYLSAAKKSNKKHLTHDKGKHKI